jgi:glycosyltransferase involved in cell wall biosynthesis
MIGPGTMRIPEDMKDMVIDLGFVSEQDKKDAYSAAMLLCQPSLNESFSIVMMESWLCNTPCLVHGNCEVTRNHVVLAGGGLYFHNFYEFAKCLDYFQKHPDKQRAMGQAGRRYVLSNFEWDVVIEKYKREAFEIN